MQQHALGTRHCKNLLKGIPLEATTFERDPATADLSTQLGSNFIGFRFDSFTRSSVGRSEWRLLEADLFGMLPAGPWESKQGSLAT